MAELLALGLRALAMFVGAVRFVISWLFYKREAKLYQGLFLGEVYKQSGAQHELQFRDVVSISRVGPSTLKGQPVYNHSGNNDYVLRLSISDKHPTVLTGTWKHKKRSEYFGTCMFHESHPDPNIVVLDGYYTGANERLSIEAAPWRLARIDGEQFKYFSLIQTLSRRAALVKNKQLLDNIIDDHERKPDRAAFEYGSLKLQIPTGCFNPRFGKISQSLLQQAIAEIGNATSGKRVIDVGCGAGFYALALAQLPFQAVVGVDTSQKSIDAAAANQKTNQASLKASVEFKKVDAEMFHHSGLGEEFDYVIANLPFSNHLCVGKHRQNPLLVNFAGNEEMLFDFIMGCRMNLKRDGKIFMSFGKSGYTHAFEYFCKIAGFKRELLKEQAEKDDIFYVYKLSFG